MEKKETVTYKVKCKICNGKGKLFKYRGSLNPTSSELNEVKRKYF